MKKRMIAKRFLTVFLAGTMLAGQMPAIESRAADTENVNPAAAENPVEINGNKRVVSTTYSDPQKWTNNWRESMVSGNGENGVLESCVPGNDTFIFQNIKFNMPTDDLRETQDLYTELETARQAVMNDSEFTSSVQPELDYDYSFHPGHQLRVKNDGRSGDISGYQRYTDYTTAEIGVEYTDDNGTWLSRTFSSREDNVTITCYEKSSSDEKLDLTLSIDDLSDMALDTNSGEINSSLRYKKFAAGDGFYIGLVGHYPVFENSELKNGGYAGVTYVLNIGGTRERVELGNISDKLYAGSDKKNYGIQVKDADAVVLITKSDRDVNLGAYDDFAAQTSWPLVDGLISDTRKAAEKYSAGNAFDYDSALAAHAEIHGAEFNKVTFELAGDKYDESLTNEQLIDKQRANSDVLNQSMAERAFYAGRYAQLCASGYSTSRLGGMWTGAWNPYWQGDYTTDANVNLQISGVNIGNMKEAAQGYISFILRIADDFEENAAQVYGMTDAIMAPPRTDGDNASIIHFNSEYPFNYWNAGAAWLILPIYEYWQCYGNEEIPIGDDVDLESLRSVLSAAADDLTDSDIQKMQEKGTLNLETEILLPLLVKLANFWEQLTDPRYYTDENGYKQYDADKTRLEDGEKYLLLPGYSPENKPSDTWCAISANTTMDVSAARSSLKMLITLYRQQGNEAAAAKWEAFLEDLPKYQYDSDGALKEWALKDYNEQNNHRHVSHMYPVWPEHEAQQDEGLMAGAKKALENRKKYNTGDNTASHGWLHQALTEARMKQGDTVEEILCGLMSSSDLLYSSMMTNHNKWGTSAYCTDASITMPAIMLEALAYSDTGVIEVLPALPGSWTEGRISGVRARSQAEITDLSWNLDENTATAVICSDIDQRLSLKCGEMWDEAVVTTGQAAKITAGEEIVIDLKAGEEAKVTFHLPSLTEGTKLYGTLTARATGSWESQTPVGNVTDGDAATFYDGEEGSWIQMELEEAAPLTGVRIVARGDGYEDRLPGVQIQGSDNGADWETLHTILGEEVASNPSWTEIYLPASGETKAYKYYRVYGADGHMVNIAELEFWGELSDQPGMALKMLIAELEGTDFGLYTEESRNGLSERIQAAKAALEDGTKTKEQLAEIKDTLAAYVESMEREWILTTDDGLKRNGYWREYADSAIRSGLELYTTNAGDSVEFQFAGTGFEMYSNKNPGLSFADIYIDGELAQDNVSLYQSTDPGSKNQLITTVSGLPYRTHTVKVVLAKEANEKGNVKISVDAFKILRETAQRSYLVRAAASDSSMGTVSIAPESEDGFYPENTEVTAAAAASEGYRFVKWTAQDGTEVSKEASYKFTVTEDISLTAVFEETAKPAADFSRLQEAVDRIGGLETEAYTEESLKALTEALNDAKAVLADKNSTQEAVDGALKALEAAEAALEEKPDKPEPPEKPVESVSFGAGSADIIIGQENQLKVIVTPADADDADKITWESSNEEVLTVDAKGNIKALWPGEAAITAKAGDKTASIKITVYGVEKIYNDVKDSDWFYDATNWAYVNDVMGGYGNGTFGPNDSLARAQFAVIMYRIAGEPEVGFEDRFPDVKDGDWFADAVIWANDNNIITGYTATGTFGPADKITREQIAAILYRYAKAQEYDVTASEDLSDFPDADKVNGFAQDAMKWAVGIGLIKGDNGKLNPQGNANRAEAATLIQRFCEAYKEE